MIIYDSNLKIFFSSLINDERFFGGFGTRYLGDGRRIDNIFNFFNNNGISYKKIVIPEQIHSTNVAFFYSTSVDNLEKIPETDGVVTKEVNSILTVITADCSPIMFVEKQQGIIGVSHQGWRGSVKRLGQKMIKKIIEMGGKKEDILVAIGPSIGECCYNIDDDRYYQFVEEFDGYSEKIFHRRQGKLHLNLSLLNYLQLKEIGIPEKNIDHFPFCTRCDKKRFFSFRRDKKEDYGEMMSFIVKS
ncbi:MAG: peptidoglycan editing factor PgeF [Candidatus Roizmanbacteria bacterium]|nr:peptidoglycan editing factor PgeF [Candidatus Roizmanbacteria bacterium]